MTTEPQLTDWEKAAVQLGHEGMHVMEAGRATHLVRLPMWERFCTCWRDIEWYTSPTVVQANEHVRCHQRNCDLHAGAIERWLDTQKKI